MLMLSKDAKLSSAITPTAGAAGTSAISASILDMADFLSVLVLLRFGAIVSGAVTSIKVSQSDDSGMSGAEDITGSAQTIADTDDDKMFYVDLHRVTRRYVQLVVSRATQNATVSAEYMQYNARKVPTTQGSNVSGETFVSAIGGTA